MREQVQPARDAEWLVGEEARALFTMEAHGVLRCMNDGTGDQAPRCFIACTAERGQAWFRFDLSAELAAKVTEIVDGSGGAGWQETVGRAGELLSSDESTRFVGPSYSAARPAAARYPRGVSGRLADQADAAAIAREISGVAEYLAGKHPVVIAVDGTRIAGACFSARRTSTVAEAGVEVIPAARGRGIGPALVAQWAAIVAEIGLVPLYSTEWTNAPSLAVARRLALPQFAVIASLH